MDYVIVEVETNEHRLLVVSFYNCTKIRGEEKEDILREI